VLRTWKEEKVGNETGVGVGERPNLFEYATSELSQDAVLCWLAKWADAACAEHDQALHRAGQAFLKTVFEECGKEFPEISSVRVERQYEHIDILVVVNDNIGVCIEDKVGTTEHSDQLRRYLDILKGKDFCKGGVVPVYVQTGEQCYSGVRKAGYGVVKRGEIIALLGEYLEGGGRDSIARDFYDHLVGIEKLVDAFRRSPCSEWKENDYAWQGFYSELQRRLEEEEVKWGYVANRKGGFWGCWWHWKGENKSWQYLQIEQGSLCFKIEEGEPTMRLEKRREWSERILEAGRDGNFPVERPQRMGKGNTMTVAVFKDEFPVSDGEGRLDIGGTVEVLRRAADVLDQAVKEKGDE